eukprot:1924584-Prymnesium_polylepis.1
MHTTQPELTAFVRTPCVRRFESRHRERHVRMCTAVFATTKRPKGQPFLGGKQILWQRCGSRLHCCLHCCGHCALESEPQRMIWGSIRTYSAGSAR